MKAVNGTSWNHGMTFKYMVWGVADLGSNLQCDLERVLFPFEASVSPSAQLDGGDGLGDF